MNRQTLDGVNIIQDITKDTLEQIDFALVIHMHIQLVYIPGLHIPQLFCSMLASFDH